jgi:hypothetical protein
VVIVASREDNPPQDLEEDEAEVYALLGLLRRQVIELVDDFAEVVVGRVERRQREVARLRSPEPGEVVSSGASDLLNVLARLLGVSRDDGPTEDEESAPDEGPGEGEEEE